MRILMSWVAHNNDFDQGQVKMDGPTFNYHRYYFDNVDQHIILSTSFELDPKVELLATALRKEFRGRDIVVKYMEIKEVININMIKEKIEPLLMSLSNNEIDIFMSPGTPSMQIVWYLCHSTLKLSTNLYQLKELKYSDPKLGMPERIQVQIEPSFIGYSALIREQNKDGHEENYKITSSIKPIYDQANLIAHADSVTTLIYGESGTGKEHLAHYIHGQSARKNKPFIAVNCSAFTDELLESRLFGHKKGSFTSAVSDHKGFFEAARGGTIFLDEIGDISPYMQQSLLRVIQEKKILPIGENKEKSVDVRILAATNKDLPKLCSIGDFRWDLYYRLAVTDLTLPPLRERGEVECKELIDYFLKAKKKMFNRPKKMIIEKNALQMILKYPFPGNVRELENLIESLYVFNIDTVPINGIPSRLLTINDEFKLDLESVEKSHISKILKIAKNNTEAAKFLGIALNTLKSKIEKYELK